MAIIGALPFTLTNGTIADATQVMADFTTIVTQVNANAAAVTLVALLASANVFTLPQTVPNGTSRVHAPNIGQLQDQAVTWVGAFVGTNTITATLTPAITAYAAGQTFRGTVTNSNTGACTINLNGLGAKALTKQGATALVANDLAATEVVEFVYDGTRFQLSNVFPFSHGADIASAATLNLSARTGRYVIVTGTVTITAITMVEGDFCIVEFSGNLTLTNNAVIILPGGASISTVPGDFIGLQGTAAGVVKATFFSRAFGQIRPGFVQDYIGVTAPTGWVLADGKTIGSAASGATELASGSTAALYTLLWNSMADAQAPVSTGRGASAAADFAANKTITLPDLRGRVVIGKDDMGGSTASRITNAGCGIVGTTQGVSGGDQLMPAHVHGLTYYDNSGGTNSGAGALNPLGTASNSTLSAGSGASGNVPPSLVLTKIIAL